MTALHSGDKIAAILRHPSCEWSQRGLARAVDMKESTLRKRLGDGEFTVPELERIAWALQVEGATILPDSLLSIATPGGLGR